MRCPVFIVAVFGTSQGCGEFGVSLRSPGAGRFILFQDVRIDALRDPRSRRLDRLARQMRVPGRAPYLPVAAQLSDHRKILAESDSTRGEAGAPIPNSE